MLERRTCSRALDKAAAVVAGEMHEALRANEPSTEILEHREHARADEWRVIGK